MRMFVVMSHSLSEAQVKEIHHRFQIQDIISLPQDLLKQWTSIPAGGPWKEHWLEDIVDWLESQLEERDKIIVQGEYGATLFLVNWLQSCGFSVYYATTERKVITKEMEDGTVITERQFSHVNFREYPIALRNNK